MRFKVDENLHEDVAEALRLRGHDALSVHDQKRRQPGLSIGRGVPG